MAFITIMPLLSYQRIPVRFPPHQSWLYDRTGNTVRALNRSRFTLPRASEISIARCTVGLDIKSSGSGKKPCCRPCTCKIIAVIWRFPTSRVCKYATSNRYRLPRCTNKKIINEKKLVTYFDAALRRFLVR
jgi:hypothetical protein